MSGDDILSHEQVATIVKEAFGPFVCKAKLCDYENELKFKVLDRGGEKLHEWRHPLDPLCEMSELKSLLDDCRAQIEQISGERLNKWELT
jgi:hypothetical protein